jgi:hypothetical protein
MIAYSLGFWPKQSVYATRMEATMHYGTCPACSAKRRNRTARVKPFFASEPVPTERCRYFDFTTIGSAGIDRRHGWLMWRVGAWCRSAEAPLPTRTETAMTTLPTNNEAWGFWGTMRYHAEPAEAWPIAMQAISRATGCADFAVRDFLDSRDGRQFADDVTNGLVRGLALSAAIEAAVERWMGWRIGRRLSRVTGIPWGLPYLLGLVVDCEIRSEAA